MRPVPWPGTASTGTPVDTESVAAFLRAHPRFLADRLELYRVLAPPVRVHGEILADHMAAMVGAERAHALAMAERADGVLAAGRAAAGMTARPGFERLVASLCAGEVGAVLCLDASRLARNGRDWHHVLELCGLVEARVIDLDGYH